MNATAETTATHVTLERTERASGWGGGNVTRFVRAACTHCGGRGLFGCRTIAEAVEHVERTRWHHDCR